MDEQISPESLKETLAPEWPEIPAWMKNPLVFLDAFLGIVLVCDLNDGGQMIHRILHGRWVTVRKVSEIDGFKFVDALNVPKPAAGKPAPEFSPEDRNPMTDRPCEFEAQAEAGPTFIVEGRPLSLVGLEGARIIDAKGKDLGQVTGWMPAPSAECLMYIPGDPRSPTHGRCITCNLVWSDHSQAALDAFDRKVKAEENPGPEDVTGVREIPARDLVLRALRNMRPTEPRPRWSWVEQRFALGSTYSIELCKNFGLDPHEVIGSHPEPEEEDGQVERLCDKCDHPMPCPLHDPSKREAHPIEAFCSACGNSINQGHAKDCPDPSLAFVVRHWPGSKDPEKPAGHPDFYRRPALGPEARALVDTIYPRQLDPTNPSNATLIEMIGFAVSGRCMACGGRIAWDSCSPKSCLAAPRFQDPEYTRWFMRTQVLTLARVLVTGGIGLPSAADLDAIAEEKKAAYATSNVIGHNFEDAS